jgi:hypothetical protein
MITEEICGRFGSFRWINVCISTPLGTADLLRSSSVSGSADYKVSASLFDGLLFTFVN